MSLSRDPLSTLGPDGLACLVAALLCAAAALAITFPVRWLGRALNVFDLPGGRKIHKRPTVRLGGIAILAALLMGIPAALWLLPGSVLDADARGRLAVLLAIATLVCALGVRDDFRPLTPALKLMGLVAAGSLLAAAGIRIEYVTVPGIGRIELLWWSGPATVAWVVACANALNLIDGVDGAGTGVAAVSSGMLALVSFGMSDFVPALVFSAVCGSTLGFLFHNREPARIFLGDSGSLLLGFLISATAVLGCTKRATALSFVAALLALSVPLLDTAQSFLRRFVKSLESRGLAPKGLGRFLRAVRSTAVGDRGHIHHRLLSRGLSHRQVTRILCLVSMVTGLSAMLLLAVGTAGALAAVLAALAGCYALCRLAWVREPPAAGVPPGTDYVLPSHAGPVTRPPAKAPGSRPVPRVRRVQETVT